MIYKASLPTLLLRNTVWSNSSSFGVTLVVSFTLAGFFPFFEVVDFLAFFDGGGDACSGFCLDFLDPPDLRCHSALS